MFKELRLIDDNISRLQNELKSSFVKSEVLLELADQIDAIYAFIQKMDNPDQGPHFQEEIEKHKSSIIQLFDRWQTLIVDAEVTQMAEDAQALSEQSKSSAIQSKLKALNAKIQTLCNDECLSMENQLMVTLARRFIAKGLDMLNKIPAPSEYPAMSTDEIADTVIHLLDIGRDFYSGQIAKGLNMYQALIPRHKEGINRYFTALDGSEKDLISTDFATIKASTVKMMQAIIAYVKEIVQGIFDGNYADQEELKLLFAAKAK